MNVAFCIWQLDIFETISKGGEVDDTKNIRAVSTASKFEPYKRIP